MPAFNRMIGKPSTVHISITDRCNLHCRMCDIWKGSPRSHTQMELSAERWIQLIDEMRSWLGPFNLKIAGGEPLLKEGVLDILSHAHDLDIFTGISTNAYLIDKNMAQKLLSSGLDEIHISLYSTDPKIHDTLRNSEGSYSRVIQAIDHLKRYSTNDDAKRRSKIKINIATVINSMNIDTLQGLVSFTEDNDLHSINFQPLFQNFGSEPQDGWHLKSDLWPHDKAYQDKLDKVIPFLISKRKNDYIVGNKVGQLEAIRRYFKDPEQKTNIRCKAGTKDIAFDPYGNMLLCFSLPPVGNIQHTSAEKIWNSSIAQKRRSDIMVCKKRCNLLNCNFEG